MPEQGELIAPRLGGNATRGGAAIAKLGVDLGGGFEDSLAEIHRALRLMTTSHKCKQVLTGHKVRYRAPVGFKWHRLTNIYRNFPTFVNFPSQ